MKVKQSEKYTVYFQPYAGGTTKSLAAKAVSVQDDGSVIFRGISDRHRLFDSIRFNPDGRSEKISISDELKDGKHISDIKINGIFKWKNHYEIQIFASGWGMSSKNGTIRFQIPGKPSFSSCVGKNGDDYSIHFENAEDIDLSVWHDFKNSVSNINLSEHSAISVEELCYDNTDWFHDAYPLSSYPIGVRIGFNENPKFTTAERHKDSFSEYDEYVFSRS